MKCTICGKEIDRVNEKYVRLQDNFCHLECWVTEEFKRGGFDKEAFGALATAVDYLLSAKLLISEIISKRAEYGDSLSGYAEAIEYKAAQLVDFILKNVLRRDLKNSRI